MIENHINWQLKLNDSKILIERTELCNSMQIKTKYHFLSICPKFNDLRKRFLSITWPTVTQFTQFINILASKRSKTQVNTLKFIKEALEMRDLSLENIV